MLRLPRFREPQFDASSRASGWACPLGDAQAKRFTELGQSELAHVCHQLAQEATRRSEGYAANADFFEK
jgi:hypothetical protein